MKNIHLIKTDKPSRLQKFINYVVDKIEFELCSKAEFFNKGQHIYITDNSEIIEGDWCYHIELKDDKVDRCYQVTKYHTWTNNGVDKTRKFKKIILTTDQDLIKDGVQAIDDEFLEWFVKNPSCEEVKITKDKVRQDKEFNDISHWNIYKYKIIIPKEEPKFISGQPFLEKADEVIVIHRPKQ
jgi:excinuclease UvrABC helicase subunit UvrB